MTDGRQWVLLERGTRQNYLASLLKRIYSKRKQSRPHPLENETFPFYLGTGYAQKQTGSLKTCLPCINGVKSTKYILSA